LTKLLANTSWEQMVASTTSPTKLTQSFVASRHSKPTLSKSLPLVQPNTQVTTSRCQQQLLLALPTLSRSIPEPTMQVLLSRMKFPNTLVQTISSFNMATSVSKMSAWVLITPSGLSHAKRKEMIIRSSSGIHSQMHGMKCQACKELQLPLGMKYLLQ